MRAPFVFSFLYFSRASSSLMFIAFSSLVLDQAYSQIHTPIKASGYSSHSYTKAEKEAEDHERKQVQSFVVELLKDYGCKDFEKKAFEVIVEQLRQNPQPRLSFRDRHKAMVSNLRVYNESDRPVGSFEPAKKEFSNLLLDLNELTTETLFSYYIDDSSGRIMPMSSSDIANILESEKVTSIETPKKKILDILTKINSLKDENNLDIGCRNEDKKNFLMLDLPRGFVSLNDVYKDADKPQEKINNTNEIKTQTVKVIPKAEAAVPKTETKVIEYSHTKINVPKRVEPPKPTPTESVSPHRETEEEKPVAKVVKPKEPSAPVTSKDKESNSEIIERYLSMSRDEVKSYQKSGWNSDYEEFIVAFILNGHTKLLRNFHQFEDVCDDLSSHNTPQKKARFIAKFFKALAIVETGADPRIETRESTTIKYRPKLRDFPSVAGKPYIQHSVGLFQLDENDYIYHGCEEIDYEKDVSIGYSNSRQRKTPWNYGGVHVEYYGDTRKSILNPFVNAACAVRILENKIPKGLISDNSYWAPLRDDKARAASRSKLKKLVKKEIPGC